ncbi:MAG: hypothetical protein WDZ80_02360 [Candidatus Paceibacterota bacterium]
MERTYKIFGKKIKINTLNNTSSEILHQELSLYPTLNTQSFDISINYVSKVAITDIISSNPTSNWLLDDSMICKIGSATIKFYFEDHQIKRIDFSIDHEPFIRRKIHKWKSIQYASSAEAIGQIFHELILVPLAFFDNNYSVVHSSGIINSQNEGVLFGGTGGVGKTSLEMVLCLKHNCSFLNDDIAVLDTDGNCYPNFSYPKIYGYNLQGAKQLKKKIFGQLSLLNKTHYALHELKGKNKVRRRVSPETFYGKVANKEKNISSFVVLLRSKVDKITMEAISADKVSDFNSIIMSTEYNSLFNHLRWHKFNALSMGRNPFVTYDSIIEENTRNFQESLSRTDKIYLAHIPMNISNEEYKVQMVQVLKEYGVL